MRSGPKKDGPTTNKIYCVGPLTAAQQEDENFVELKLNTHFAGQKMPGSSLIYADVAAPDLLDWLISVIQEHEVTI